MWPPPKPSLWRRLCRPLVLQSFAFIGVFFAIVALYTYFMWSLLEQHPDVSRLFTAACMTTVYAYLLHSIYGVIRDLVGLVRYGYLLDPPE